MSVHLPFANVRERLAKIFRPTVDLRGLAKRSRKLTHKSDKVYDM